MLFQSVTTHLRTQLLWQPAASFRDLIQGPLVKPLRYAGGHKSFYYCRSRNEMDGSPPMTLLEDSYAGPQILRRVVQVFAIAVLRFHLWAFLSDLFKTRLSFHILPQACHHAKPKPMHHQIPTALEPPTHRNRETPRPAKTLKKRVGITCTVCNQCQNRKTTSPTVPALIMESQTVTHWLGEGEERLTKLPKASSKLPKLLRYAVHEVK